MIESSNKTDEIILADAYQQEKLHYLDALRTAEALTHALRTKQKLPVLTQQLAFSLEKVETIESQIVAVKTRWGHHRQKPGPDLKTILDQIADLILKLKEQVDLAWTQAAGEYSQLQPQLDMVARSQLMLRSYGNTLSR